jgi:hypothetical protein
VTWGFFVCDCGKQADFFVVSFMFFVSGQLRARAH